MLRDMEISLERKKKKEKNRSLSKKKKQHKRKSKYVCPQLAISFFSEVSYFLILFATIGSIRMDHAHTYTKEASKIYSKQQY